MTATDSDIYQFIYTPGKWFKIPDFQRPYSWHVENCKAFLIDLEDLLNSDKTHFFGSIVYETKGDESIIIDGQQRITTVSLMIMAIYHLVCEDPSLAGGSLSAEDIKDWFLWNERRTEGDKSRIKLRGITNDAKIFQQIYDQGVEDNNQKSEMYKVYSYFREYFADKRDLHRYIEALKRLRIVKILLDLRDDQPQKIFESINATGQALNNGDKIRNFALMMEDDTVRTRVFNRYWIKIEQRLTDNTTGRDDIADFFWRSLVSNKQEVIKEGDVYTEFKKFFGYWVKDLSDEAQIYKFWQETLDDLERYCFLKYRPDDAGKLTEFRSPVSRLGYLAIGVYLPYLMKVLKHWYNGDLTSEQVQAVLAVTETYLVRRGLLGYRIAGLNNFYATLDKNIREKLSDGQSSYEDIYRYMVTRGGYDCPKPAELESRLMDINFYRFRSGFKNFVLSSYDDKKLPKESSLLKQLGQKDSSLSIEHIMPQDLRRNEVWKKELGEYWHDIHGRYCHSLANLTLTGYNSEYSNKSFSEKLNAPNGFSQSSLAINRDSVAIHKVFDKKALDKRMAWWLKVIEQIWPYPESGYTPTPDSDSYEEATLEELALSDLSHSNPHAVVFRQQAIDAAHWVDVMEIVLSRIYEDDDRLVSGLRGDPEINQKISQHSQDFISSVRIADSDWLVDSKSDTNAKIALLNRAVDLTDIGQQDIQIRFSRNDSEAATQE